MSKYWLLSILVLGLLATGALSAQEEQPAGDPSVDAGVPDQPESSMDMDMDGEMGFGDEPFMEEEVGITAADIEEAGRGSPEMQLELGIRYLTEVSDNKEGIRWIVRAAKSENIKAQLTLWALYDRGYGYDKTRIKPNAKKAVNWLTQAASMGDSNAQYTLARYYQLGENVKKEDPVTAYAWLLVYAAHEHPEAALAKPLALQLQKAMDTELDESGLAAAQKLSEKLLKRMDFERRQEERIAAAEAAAAAAAEAEAKAEAEAAAALFGDLGLPMEDTFEEEDDEDLWLDEL
ncbi:MAG: sel1 repeat family protein [Gammaproteobacteria bacterium AqS3]|nr:sel1 repeat family protein [Gammaproteobacteria bacterium AqS3]